MFSYRDVAFLFAELRETKAVEYMGIWVYFSILMGRRERRHEHTGRKCRPRIQLRLSSRFFVHSKFSFSSSSPLSNREAQDTTEGERRRETVNDKRGREIRGQSIGRAGTGTRPTISRKEPHYKRNTRRPTREPCTRSPVVSCGSETMGWLGPFQNTHIQNGAL